MLCELRKAMQQHSTGTAQLIAALEAAQQPATGNMPLTQLQKQVRDLPQGYNPEMPETRILLFLGILLLL